MRIGVDRCLAYPLSLTGRVQSLAGNQRMVHLVRVAVLASSVLLMLPGAWNHSVTIVEFAHLPAGLSAWQRHSFSMYRVCGPLSKFLYALPAHLAGVRVDYPASLDADVRARQELQVGRIFQNHNCELYHNIYRWSRLVPILVTILGGCLICEWSTRLFGSWPGVVSLCVWCWMPLVLGHGSLITSDTLAAVMAVLAARSFWALLMRPSLVAAILAGVALGMAQASKFSLLILYPSWGSLLIVRSFQGRTGLKVRPEEVVRSFPWLVLFLVIMTIVSLLTVDALYLFQDVGFTLGEWRSGQSSLGRDIEWLGMRRATSWLLQVPLPIPQQFLNGLDTQLADTERLHSAYLLGWSRLGGWWYWYAVAALIKVPLPIIVLFGLALLRLPSALRGGDPVFWADLCLLLPAVEIFCLISASTGTGTNAAFRYLLPSFALLCVWAGDARSAGLGAGRLTPIALLGWLAVNAVIGAPDHLGWQNEVGWGWSRLSGRPSLIGDSLEWGQELARLGDWVSRHSREGYTLVCAYGVGDAEPFGLHMPIARSTSHAWDGCCYLAVSEQVLFGDNLTTYTSVGGARSHLDEHQREALAQARPVDRVGRAIRIYRIRDLGPDFSPSRPSKPGGKGSHH